MKRSFNSEADSLNPLIGDIPTGKSKKADIKEELDHLLDLPPNIKDYTYDQAIALARMALSA